MEALFAVIAAVALLCQGGTAGAVAMETVVVGDAGNSGELSGAGAGGSGPDRVCGGVGYNYRIGKYEVTAGQYCDFLNHKAATDTYGLYNTWMSSNSYGCKIERSGSSGGYTYSVASDWANRPVNFVSYWDSLRFANWLNNGQGDGDTETGAYTLNGYNGSDGREIQRNPGATWILPTEDEWYKAAYYKGGVNAGYWDYPTQSDSTPSNLVVDPDPGNNANYFASTWCIGSPYFRTNVGEFENSESAYGTFDQGGNIWEWNEAMVHQDVNYGVLRGGSLDWNYGVSYMLASTRVGWSPLTEDYAIGFRVAAAVPEPSSLLCLSVGGLGLLFGRTRRRA